MSFAFRRADVVHLLLLLAALAASYALPFELLLLSYAILGPAHYFTEINWLHDRRYFLPNRWIALLPAAAAVAAMVLGDAWWSGLLVWLCLAGAVVLALPLPMAGRFVLGAGIAAITAAIVWVPGPLLLAGMLLPTFIHVCIFTLAFMTLGAMRARSGAQFAIIVLYLAAIAAILVVPPSAKTVIPALARLGEIYFGGVATALGQLTGIPGLQFGRVTGLLSFVYTYHYLNWFIKADVIKWAAIPRGRLIAIVALSAASTALYFYDYEIGLAVLLFVSLTHVLLEFPLNGLSVMQLVTFRRSAA
jgi:hypothetical protein